MQSLVHGTEFYQILAGPGLWTLLMVTLSCLEFPFAPVTTTTSMAWSLTESSPSKTTCLVYCVSCLTETWYFEVGEACLCGHLCDNSFLLCICSCDPSVLFPGVEVSCLLSLSASWASGEFSGQEQGFLSLCHRRHVAGLCLLNKGNSNSYHCLFSELPGLFLPEFDRPSSDSWSFKCQGVERHNLRGVSCRPKFVCRNSFPTLCSSSERWSCVFFRFLRRWCLWGFGSNL